MDKKEISELEFDVMISNSLSTYNSLIDKYWIEMQNIIAVRDNLIGLYQEKEKEKKSKFLKYIKEDNIIHFEIIREIGEPNW